jgi:hypothetical protein
MSVVLTPTGIPSMFFGLGKLQFAPNNAPDDPFPTYVDITPYVRTESDLGQPLQTVRGAQNELSTIQSGTLSCTLDNTDDRFTFGLTSGPYGSGWDLGKKVQYLVTIGSRTFVVYTGYIETVDVPSWEPIGYKTVTLTCTDRLTRFGRGAAFVSNLGAHILFNGGTTLKALYPMSDQLAPFSDQSGNAYPSITATTSFGNTPGTPTGVAGWQPASVTGPLGDDISVVALTMQTVGTQDQADVHLTVDFEAAGRAIPVLAGQTVTVSAWFNADPSALANPVAVVLSTHFNSSPGVLYDTMDLEFDATGTTNGGSWFGHHSGGPDFVGGKAVGSHWVPIAIRYSWSPQTFEFWFADQPAQSGSWSGSPPASLTLAQLYVTSEAYAGALAYVQVYVGAPNAFTHSMWLAQMQMGLVGLEYQTTGERVNTLLDYAGVPSTERSVDPGQSFMANPSLAGVDPLTALQNAVDTERGRGFISGDGLYVFHDRVHVLNV